MEGVKGLLIFLLLVALSVFDIKALEAEEPGSSSVETTNTTNITTVPQEETPLYSPEGKRDPFKPFIRIIQEEKQVTPRVNLPPIKRYPLEEFRLVGIVQIGEQPKAMVVDPEKNTYVLGVGDEIGNKQGKIIEIRNNGILVEEKRVFEDVFGHEKVETRKSVLAFREE
jgi:Tfp pilus assembly protein PilP